MNHFIATQFTLPDFCLFAELACITKGWQIVNHSMDSKITNY